MDFLSIIGMSMAIGAVLVAQHLEGGTFASLVNFPALLIVLCGTLGAVLAQTPGRIFIRALTLLRWLFISPSFKPDKIIDDLVAWDKAVRKYGPVALDDIQADVADPFVKKGLNLLMVGSQASEIQHALELELAQQEYDDIAASKVYASMGGYSPTLGILGAVLGLIQVMSNLTDPSLLGSGIAVAFVATVYGVGFANLIFIPIGNKLRSIAESRSYYRELLIEGIMAIAEGENPQRLATRLKTTK